jgi:hypothetical protein
MSTKHSPGPWAIDSGLPPNDRPVIARVGSIPISANMHGPHINDFDSVQMSAANPYPAPDLSNAKLIAAAPELLAALELCIASVALQDEDGEALRIARAVVTKIYAA